MNLHTRILPKAAKKPHTFEIHGDVRIDNYHWMRLSDAQKEAAIPDSQTTEVLDYLNAENAFFESEMKHTEAFQKSVFEEMKGRIKEDDSSVPYKKNGYYYITRYELGKQYPIYTRKKESLEAPEEILFDVNEMAEGYEYFTLGGLNISPDNSKAIYGVDTVSRRQYTLYVKDLLTGETYKDTIKNTTGGGVWANDNRTFFYTKKDAETLRSNQIYRHRLGTDASEDVLVFEEKDETFNVYVTKSKS
ncbi:MAG: oligopeptidase B, partial [Flavicella sp.]